MRGLSSLTRDQTHFPCIGKQSFTGQPGKSLTLHLFEALQILQAKFSVIDDAEIPCRPFAPVFSTAVGSVGLEFLLFGEDHNYRDRSRGNSFLVISV